jgi:hypothetical protein
MSGSFSSVVVGVGVVAARTHPAQRFLVALAVVGVAL